MKDLKRKLIAALGAVTIAVTSALPASAVYDMSTDNAREIKSSNNDPYLNITLDNGGLSTSGLKFTLKKDGKAIATLNGGMSKATVSLMFRQGNTVWNTATAVPSTILIQLHIIHGRSMSS